MPANLENAKHLTQRAFPRSHVAQPKCDGEDVKRPLREGQRHGIGYHQIPQTLALCDLQHGLTEIRANNEALRAGLPQSQSQISAARGEIQDPGRIPTAHPMRDAPAPQEIQAAAQQMISEIITVRYGSEHNLNGGAFFVSNHRAGTP